MTRGLEAPTRSLFSTVQALNSSPQEALEPRSVSELNTKEGNSCLIHNRTGVCPCRQFLKHRLLEARRLQGSITLSSLGLHGFFPPILAHLTLCINQIVLEHLDNNHNITIHT